MFFERLWDRFVVFVNICRLNSLRTAPAKGQTYIFDSIALIIGWVTPSYIYTDIILDGIIDKLLWSVCCVKRAMDKVSVCGITLILGQRQYLGIVVYLLVWLLQEKVEVQKPIRTFAH